MRHLAFISIAIILLSGCATQRQQTIQYSEMTLPSSAKIGIAMSEIPSVSSSYPGASCLLCLAAAAAANSGISGYAKKELSSDDLKKIPTLVQDKLKELGYESTIIDSPLKSKNLPKTKSKALNTAKKDYTYFKEKYDVDYLIGIEFSYVGIQRQYSQYVPTSAPQALILGIQYAVKIEDNTYTWYKPLNTYRSAEGEWKEPPSYPGITNAFYQVIEHILEDVVNTSNNAQ